MIHMFVGWLLRNFSRLSSTLPDSSS